MGVVLARAESRGIPQRRSWASPLGDGEPWQTSSNAMTPSDGVSESSLWGLSGERACQERAESRRSGRALCSQRKDQGQWQGERAAEQNTEGELSRSGGCLDTPGDRKRRCQ